MAFSNEKAVSEVLGSLMVSMMIVSVASLLYVMSTPTIQHGMDEITHRNIVKNMFELKEIVDRVRKGVEPVSTKVFPLGGGKLAVNRSAVTVSVGAKNYVLGDLDYSYKGTTISLESGIFEVGNPLSISPPIVERGGNVIYIVFYNVTGNLSVSGDKAWLKIHYVNYTLIRTNSITITTRYAENWVRAFSTINANVVWLSGNTLNVQGDLMVYIYTVRFE